MIVEPIGHCILEHRRPGFHVGLRNDAHAEVMLVGAHRGPCLIDRKSPLALPRVRRESEARSTFSYDARDYFAMAHGSQLPSDLHGLARVEDDSAGTLEARCGQRDSRCWNTGRFQRIDALHPDLTGTKGARRAKAKRL